MNYEFDQCVDRAGIGNMKRAFATEEMLRKNIEGFSAAEMDFKTAPCVREALHRLVDRGIFGFTVQTPEYNEHIRWWLEETRHWQISPQWIVPTLGTIFSVATTIRLTCGDTGRIIVQTPVYYRYEQAARRMGLETVHCPLKNDGRTFKMDFDALESAMADPKNRLLVLCNPHNPTGNVWGREDLQRIASLSKKYGVYVFSDEIFADDVFEKAATTPYASIAEGREYAITCTSLGKSFNYTGVNHADLIIPDDLLRDRFLARRDADHFGSVGPFEYVSVLAAYTPEGLEWQRASVEYMRENAAIMKEAFSNVLAPNYLYPIEGAFVAFVDWRGLKLSGDALAGFLEKEACLQVEPGEHYGEGYGKLTRLSLGSTHAQTRAAMERVAQAIAKHPEYVVR